MSLGCGTYRAFILGRGGSPNYTELPWSALRFARRLDDVSDANVEVPASGRITEECCSVLNGLRSWQHELAVYRDDDLWVGPIGNPRFTTTGVTIPARDLGQWFERRTLPHDRAWSEEDLGVIFAQLIADGMEADTSPNITCEPTATGVFGARTVDENEHARLADHLRELARSGLDYTVLGREVVIGGVEVPAVPIPLIGTGYLDDPELVVVGLDAASEVTVLGSAGDEEADPIVGVAGGVDPTIGLVQLVFTESNIEDNPSARRAALTRLAMLADVPEYVTGVLSPDAPVTFAELIPGARVDLAVQIGCREALGTWRLAGVDAAAQVQDDGAVAERVGVSFIPLGSVDGDQ